MAKITNKLPSSIPKVTNKRTDEYDKYFVAKSPYNGKKSKTNYKSMNVKSDVEELEDGFPIIKAREGAIIVTFGGIQLVAGLLMVAFGVLTMLHEASMSGIGAGLWGGATGIANGLVGIVTGFKGCYQKADRISPLAVTVYLALCLVAIGVGNLALVLTATGLLRDSQKPIYFLPLKPDEEYSGPPVSSMDLVDQLRPNWAPILTNLGLLLITSIQCLATIGAAFRCYLHVCRCRGDRRFSHHSSRNYSERRYQHAPSTDVATASYCCSTSSSKQKLVRQWLGQHQHQSTSPSPAKTPVPFYPPVTSYCVPPPYYTIDRRPRPSYPNGSYVSYSDYNYMIPPHNGNKERYSHWPKVQLHQPQEMGVKRFPLSDSRSKMEKKHVHKARLRKMSAISTTEEIDKTYTGLDREIAEEFISVAMEPKHSSVSS